MCFHRNAQTIVEVYHENYKGQSVFEDYLYESPNAGNTNPESYDLVKKKRFNYLKKNSLPRYLPLKGKTVRVERTVKPYSHTSRKFPNTRRETSARQRSV